MDAITFQTKDELGFCTRQSDGVSGMTIRALSNFCGLAEGSSSAISNLLTQIEDSEPETNTLPETLKPFAGQRLRLETNDSHGSLYVIDELCHAILEYYAVDARKYKGKQIAVNNYRMVARAGLRVFIWSQTGYSPQTLSNEQLALLQAIPAMQQAIAQLQAQIQNLLPPSADFIPPGWDAEVWRSLPSQDKRHFRFLYRRRNFRPSQENQPLALPAATVEQLKERQRAEVERLVGEVSPEEKQQFQAAKLQKLREFWSQASVEEQKDMPF
ncbi:DNA-damage-inducible protein (plasmid) [Nostoc sp. HK-01]|nr:DNA-damage-inducible protein [Nostoc sp. HK-01]